MREPTWKAYGAKADKPILTPKQCQELIDIGQAQPKLDATIQGRTKPSDGYRKCKINWIPFDKAPTSYGLIKEWMNMTNINFFNFDNMQMNEQGQYTEYSQGDFYNWHMDIYKDMRTMPPVRKISMTLLLNDPKEFEGGELEIYNKELSAPTDHHDNFKLKQGQAVFFASFLLHRVTPIIEGNRKSLVMWFGGPPFK